jgi:hypothetical protein
MCLSLTLFSLGVTNNSYPAIDERSGGMIKARERLMQLVDPSSAEVPGHGPVKIVEPVTGSTDIAVDRVITLR